MEGNGSLWCVFAAMKLARWTAEELEALKAGTATWMEEAVYSKSQEQQQHNPQPQEEQQQNPEPQEEQQQNPEPYEQQAPPLVGARAWQVRNRARICLTHNRVRLQAASLSEHGHKQSWKRIECKEFKKLKPTSEQYLELLAMAYRTKMLQVPSRTWMCGEANP